eukprot:gene19820-23706_t
MAPKAATDADAPTRRGTSTAAHDNISRRGDLSVDTAARLEPAILSPTERNHQEVSSRILAENTGEDPSEDLASFEVGTEQSCIDRALEDGSAWRDTEGYSCYEYIKYNWCSSTSSDGYGSDWADAWGNFENWSDDLTVCSEPTHHTPVYSCCDCGGGEVVVRECGAVNADEMVLDVVVASKEDGADIDWKLLAGSDTGAVLSKGSNYEPHSNHVTKMCLLNNTEYTLQLVALDSAGWSGGHVSLWSEESLHAVGAGCALLFEVGMEERGTSNFTFNFTSDSACLNPSVPVNYTSNGEPVIVASNFYYAGRQLAQLVNDTHVVLLNSNVVLGNPLPILSEKDLEVTGICHGDAISNRSGGFTLPFCFIDGVRLSSFISIHDLDNKFSVTLRYLKLQSIKDYVMYGYGNAFLMDHCIVSQFQSSAYSAVHINHGGKAVIRDSKFSNNRNDGTTQPPTITVFGATAGGRPSSLVLTRTVLDSNEVSLALGIESRERLFGPSLESLGPAKYASALVLGAETEANLTECIFRNNSGKSTTLVEGNTNMRISACVIEDNHALLELGGEGGFIYVSAPDVNVEISDSKLTGNHA